jgi:hypothetical protein
VRVAEGDSTNTADEGVDSPMEPLLEEEGDGVTSSEDEKQIDGDISCSSSSTVSTRNMMDVECNPKKLASNVSNNIEISGKAMMNIYVYIYIYIYIYMYKYVYKYEYMNTYVDSYIHTYICR